MQRIFLAQEGYHYFRQIPSGDRKDWFAPLQKMLNSSKAKEVSSLRSLAAGDAHVFLLDLAGDYQALFRKFLDDGDEPSACWVLLAIAPKNQIDELAQTLRFTWDGETAGLARVKKGTTQIDPLQPFLCYGSSELAAFGVPESLLSKVKAASGEEGLKALEGDLTPHTYYRLLEISEKFAALVQDDLTLLHDKVPKGELEKLEDEICQSLDDIFHSDRFYLFENDASLKKILDQDCPAWMLFPLPDQKKWITRNFKGPTLIRGVAGSGKSTLAILRSKYLAEELLSEKDEAILLVTPIRHAAKFLEEDLRATGGSLVDKVEVNHVYGWATAYLQSLSMESELNSTLALEMLKEAIDHCRQGMPNITPSHLDFNFVRDEISSMIKGRALHSQPDYLALPRRGFGTPLTNEEKRHLWRIYLKYQSLLAANKIMDSDDLLLNAYHNLKKTPPKTKYAAIIVDDAQDLSAVAVKMFHQMVKDRPNGLFLLSDSTQKLTRNGDLLSNLQVELSIRPPLLRTNLRNTREIAQAGLAVLGNTRFEEMDGSSPAPAVQPEVSKRGPKPTVHSHESEDQEILWLLDLINELTSEAYGYKHGDIAVVSRSNRYLTILELNLNQAQIPSVNFKKSGHDRITNAVKICSYPDCKGMEFPVVILTEASEGILPKVPSGVDAEELAAHLAREQRLLYCGMSQAKEMLYLSSYNATPSRFLAPLLSESQQGTADTKEE